VGLLAALLLACAHASVSVAASPGQLVLTGVPGRVTIGFGPDQSAVGDGFASADDEVTPLSSGDLLLTDFDQFGQPNELGLVALRPSGARDTGFGTSGLVRLPVPGSFSSVAAEPDGGALLLVSGQDSANGPYPLALLRIDARGALNPAFGADGVDRLATLDEPAAMTVQADGRIVIASTADANTAQSRVVITRLTATGAPDPTFGGVTLPQLGQSADSVALAPNGDIITLGSPGVLAALTPAGALDPSFNHGAPVLIASAAVSAASGAGAQELMVLPSGRIEVLYGPVQQTSGPESLSAYTPAGTIDPAFGHAGTEPLAVSPDISGPEDSMATPDLLPTPAGGSLVVVPTDGDAPQLIRLLSSGQPDPSFGGANGRAVNLGFGGASDFGETAAESPNGTVYLPGVTEFAFFTGAGSGEANNYVAHDGVAALTPSLTPDTAFGAGSPVLRMGVRVSADGSDALRLRLTPSQASVVAVRVTAGGKRIGSGGPILLYSEKPSEHVVLLSAAAVRRLRGRTHVTVAVTATSLVGQTRTFHATATVG